jgi:hypothetical protein
MWFASHPALSAFRASPRTAAALLLTLVGGACRREQVIARQGDLLITGAYAHPSAGDAGAVYLRVRNTGTTPDTLASVGGPDSASMAMLMTTNAGHMQAEAQVVIASGTQVVMQPGGLHVMLSGLTGEYKIGDTLRVRLRFARAGSLTVAAPVVAYGEMP